MTPEIYQLIVAWSIASIIVYSDTYKSYMAKYGVEIAKYTFASRLVVYSVLTTYSLIAPALMILLFFALVAIGMFTVALAIIGVAGVTVALPVGLVSTIIYGIYKAIMKCK